MRTTGGKIKRRIRASFSLLELIIVLAIVASCAAVVGTRIFQGSSIKKFQKSIKAIQHHIELAKRLAHITRNETRVLIERKDSTYKLYLEGDGLTEALKKKFAIGRPLDGIREIDLQGKEPASDEKIRIPLFGHGPAIHHLHLQIIGQYQTVRLDLDQYSTATEGDPNEAETLYPKYYKKEDLLPR